MKIFLAGATGVVGRLLLPLFIDAGHAVIGSTRDAAKAKQIADAGGEPVIVDVLNRKATFAAVHNAQPDAVIHQLTDLSERDFAANSRLRVEGTRNLVDASLAVGVQRVIAQSIAWMYVPGVDPAHEDEPLDVHAPAPRDLAVAAVSSLEHAVAKMPIGVILRYGLFYGPGTWYGRDGLTTQQMRRGDFEASDGVTSFVHVADAAQAAIDALRWPAGSYNIVDDAPAKGSEWVPVYAGLVGASHPLVKPDAPSWERGASNAKVRSLGWRPIHPSWREGFRTALG